MTHSTITIRRHLTAALPAALALTSAPAHAQQASLAGSEPASWAPDINVTGERETYAEPGAAGAAKTNTPLIQVPQSVQVLTDAQLREQDRRQLGEALANVSGVVGNRPEEGLIAGPLSHRSTPARAGPHHPKR